MNLPPFIKETEAALEGWPDEALTAILFLLGVLAICVALFSPSRVVKAVLAAWFIAP